MKMSKEKILHDLATQQRWIESQKTRIEHIEKEYGSGVRPGWVSENVASYWVSVETAKEKVRELRKLLEEADEQKET